MARTRKNPGDDGLLNLLITGGVVFALYLWLQNNCASASPLSTSLCTTLFGTAASSTSSTASTCLATFEANVLAAAGGNTTLYNSAIAALTSADVAAIQASCTAGTVPAIPADAQAVITAGLKSGSSSGSSSAPSSSAGTSVAIPSNLAVTTDINNSLKGTVNVNGVNIVLTIIPGNASNATGVIWNSAGQDITSQFTAAEISQLVAAFNTAAANQGLSGLAGLAGNRIPASFIHGFQF